MFSYIYRLTSDKQQHRMDRALFIDYHGRQSEDLAVVVMVVGAGMVPLLAFLPHPSIDICWQQCRMNILKCRLPGYTSGRQ